MVCFCSAPLAWFYSALDIGTGAPGASAPAYVQGTTGTGDSLAYSSSVTSGNTLLVEFQSMGSLSGITVTDTLGTTFTLVASQTGVSSHANIAVYAGTASSGGADTVTIGSPPANADLVGVSEVSNITTTMDTHAGNASSTQGFDGTRQLFSINVANSPDYVFAVAASANDYDPWTTTAPFSVDASNSGAGRAQMITHTITTGPGSVYFWTSMNPHDAYLSGLMVGFRAKADCVNGATYYDTTSTPYVPYVCNAGTWAEF